MSRAYFDAETIEEIRGRADIVAVISEHVRLRKAGRNYVGLCPFHQEKTPSFNVDPDKQFYYCFGCGAGGDVFAFLMKGQGLSFPEAVMALAQRTGVSLPAPRMTSEDDARARQKKRLFAALEFAREKYREHLFSPSGAEALSYLTGRGLSREIIEKFQLGACPDRWDYITESAGRAGFGLSDFETAGLLVKRAGGGYYDRFRHRVIFPVWDGRGALIAFAGRALGDDPAKYLNAPETPLFHKGRELYGLNLAKPAIRLSGRVLVMEGYMDVITAFQYGIDYAVAGMGTALTEYQARTLLLLAEQVFLAYDGDEAGKRAVRRVIDIFREAGGKTSVVTLDDAKDPDAFLRKRGVQEFVEKIQNAHADISFIYEEARSLVGAMRSEGKLKVAEAMVPVLASLESNLERTVYVEEIARDLGIRKESLDKDVELYIRQRSSAPKYKKSENRDTNGYDNQRVSDNVSLGQKTASKAGSGDPGGELSISRRRAEEGIVRCLLEEPGLTGWVEANVQGGFLDEDCARAFGALSRGPVSSIRDEKTLAWLAELCVRFGPVEDPRRILTDCLRRLREVRLAELRDQMAIAERRNDARAFELLEEYQKLLKEVKSKGEDGDGPAAPGDFLRREEV